ncbi:hypothetical protein PG987_012312 [Apiospora arundinis]
MCSNVPSWWRDHEAGLVALGQRQRGHHYDLRSSPDDLSQRMMVPGEGLPEMLDSPSPSPSPEEEEKAGAEAEAEEGVEGVEGGGGGEGGDGEGGMAGGGNGHIPISSQVGEDLL